jgi:hypothetical protein
MFSFDNKSREFQVHGISVEITTLGGARIYTKNPDEAKLINKYLHDEGYFDNLGLMVAANKE